MLAIYCRISQDKEEGKDRSIEEQKLQGIDKAKELGMDYKLYIDEGVSGTWEISKRPQFFEMVLDIDSSLIKVVYAMDVSRLYRNDEVRLQFLSTIRKKNVELYTDSGIFDWSDPQVKLLDSILSAMNVFHVDLTKKKVKQVLTRKVSQGKIFAVLPYGYGKDEEGTMVIDDNEAKIVRLIFKWSLEGIGQKTIADKLNDMKEPTRYQKIGKGTYYEEHPYTKEITVKNKKDAKWVAGTIQSLMKNRVYMGERKYGGEIYECPAIVSKEYYDKMRKNLTKNRSATGSRVFHKYLLNGLCECGVCGKAYKGRKTNVAGTGYVYYKCTTKRKGKDSCGNPSVKLEYLNKLVWNRLFSEKVMQQKVQEHFNDQKVVDGVEALEQEYKKMHRTIEEINKKKYRVIDLAADGVLANEDIKSRMDQFNRELEELGQKATKLKDQIEYRLSNREKAKEVEQELGHIRENTPYNEKQAILNKYIKKVRVLGKTDYFMIEVDYHIDIPGERWLLGKDYQAAVDFGKRFLIQLKDLGYTEEEIEYNNHIYIDHNQELIEEAITIADDWDRNWNIKEIN